MPAILEGLFQELRYIHEEDEKLLDDVRRSAKKSDDDTPLIGVDHSNLRSVLSNKHLSPTQRTALRWFLGRFKRSQWMQRQRYFPERIGIGLLARWQGSDAFVYCGYGGRFCNQPDYCFRCAFIRARRALKEYENVYERTLHDGTPLFFYAVSPSFEWRSRRAGLHFVEQKENRDLNIPAKINHWHPFAGEPDLSPLSGDSDLLERSPIRDCFQIIFDFAKSLQYRKLFAGTLAHRHIAWHFFEKEDYPHHVTPNGHFLVSTTAPLTFENGQSMLGKMAFLMPKRPSGLHIYPDLHIEELTSQAEINRWIYYMFKPMDFVTPYLRAIKRGVSVAVLNYEVSDRVFQGGGLILSIPSPKRYGVLHSKGTGYLGTIPVTRQREQEKQERKARRDRRERKYTPAKGPADNYLHKQARIEEILKGR